MPLCDSTIGALDGAEPAPEMREPFCLCMVFLQDQEGWERQACWKSTAFDTRSVRAARRELRSLPVE